MHRLLVFLPQYNILARLMHNSVLFFLSTSLIDESNKQVEKNITTLTHPAQENPKVLEVAWRSSSAVTSFKEQCQNQRAKKGALFK